MPCARVQTAISADLDGEASTIPPEEVRRHLARCLACRRFQAGALGLQRRTRAQEAPRVPDLTAEVLAAIAPVSTPGPGRPTPA